MRVPLLASALFLLIGLALFFLVSTLLPLAPFLDFTVLYYSAVGTLHGLHWYDEAALAGWIQHYPWPKVEILPQAYPAWYCALTVPLGYFSPRTAARIWATFNLSVMSASFFILADRLGARKRLWYISAAFLFPPTLGIVIVGQYDAPILFGAALLLSSFTARSPMRFAIGAALLTFKPHLGWLMFSAALMLALTKQRTFWRPAFQRLLIVLLAMVVLPAFYQPSWPRDYFASLTRLAALPVNVACDTCSSLTISIARWSLSSGATLWSSGALVCALLAFLTIALLWRYGRQIDPRACICLVILATLIVNPYARNYDFVLSLVPIGFLLERELRMRDIVFIAGAWILQAIASLGMDRGEGTTLLWLGACLLILPLTASLHVSSQGQGEVALERA